MNSERSRPLRLIFTFGLLALAFVSATLAITLDRYIFPQLIVKDPFATSTAIYQETQATALYASRYLAVASGFAAFLFWLVPLENISWRRLAFGVLVMGALLRLATPEMALHSVPKPDGVHYQLLAMNLLAEHKFTIQTGPFEVPSRMPLAPSLVMALTTWLQPAYFGTGIFSIWLSGCLGMFVLYRAGRRLWSADVGLLAALLVALSPLHGHYARQLMGEMPWALGILIALWLTVGGSRSPGRWFVAGLALGLCMLFKPLHLGIIAAFFCALAWDPIRSREWRRLAPPIFFCIGAVLGVLPLLLYQRVILGGWLTTGYHVYDLSGATVEKLFSLRYLFGPDVKGRGVGTIPAYLLAFSGFDPRPEKTLWYFPLNCLLLLLPFSWKAWRARDDEQRLTWRIAAWATLLFAAPFLFYGYNQPRFFLPVLPLWALLVAKPAADWVAQRRAERLLACALFVALIVLIALAAAHLKVQTAGVREPDRAILKRLSSAMESYDAIATDEDPALMTHFGVWRAGKELIPIRAPGQPWYTDNPEDTLRTQGTVSRVYEGPVPAIQRRLDQGKRVAMWMRYPHRNRSVGDDIRNRFRIENVPGQGVPGLCEVQPLEKPFSE